MMYELLNVNVYAPILDAQLKAQYPDYQHLCLTGTKLHLYFSTAQNEQDLAAFVANHTSTYPTSFEYLFDVSTQTQTSNIEFARQLLHDWMRKNQLEGMNIYQSLWVFSRFETFTLTAPFGTQHVDLFKMFYAGAIPTVYYAILRVQPDPMTESYHWLTQERLDWVKGKLAERLGPASAAYIQGLA